MSEIDRTACVGCRHFYFSGSEPGYSEYTPGADMDIGCNLNLWPRDATDSEPAFREAMRMSRTCTRFEAIEVSR